MVGLGLRLGWGRFGVGVGAGFGMGLERKCGSQIAFQSMRSAGWPGGWPGGWVKIVPTLDQPTGFSHRSECGNK